MNEEFVLERWQIKIMMRVAIERGIKTAQAMHEFIWGTPEGPAIAMTLPGPVVKRWAR